jgi:hypothetical protein
MGFNTTVVVHNDSLHTIEKDPDFGKNLVQAIRVMDCHRSDKVIDVPSINHANAAEVIETHHADQIVAVAIGANSGAELGYAGHWSLFHEGEKGKVEMLRTLADKLGYQLRKKPKNNS